MFATPPGSKYDRFSKGNKPSSEMFRQLFNAILWKSEPGDTAGTEVPGHVLKATADQIKARTNTSNNTVVADVTQLPGLMLGDDTGYTIYGSAVKKDGLHMREYTNDTTGAKDFMLDFLASSTYFVFDETTKELKPKGTIGNGKYWGTPDGDSTIGFYDLTTITSTKVLVSGEATADYLNSNQFQYVDNTVHVALKLTANKIWVGKDYGTYESVEEVATGTAFNKNFGHDPGEVPEIGTELAASLVVMTDSNQKLSTVAVGDAHNKNFGTTAGTVSEGDHVHAAFTTSVNGFVPAPGSVAGKVLSDSGTWIEMQSAADTYKVKASSADGTPDFLDNKVDGTYITVTSNELTIIDNSISFGQLDEKVLQYAEITLSHTTASQLNSNPQTVISCPSVAGNDVRIIVVDASIEVNYTDTYYQTYVTMNLKHANASAPLYTEDYALTSTVDRELMFKMNHVSNATDTQVRMNEDLVLDVSTGNPVAVGGTTFSATIKVWYRLQLTEQLP